MSCITSIHDTMHLSAHIPPGKDLAEPEGRYVEPRAGGEQNRASVSSIDMSP